MSGTKTQGLGGSCDAVFKAGQVLFPSILKVVAARQLAELFAASGEEGKAKLTVRTRRECDRDRADVPAFGSRRSEGWLHSRRGRQSADVWGSAFAVHPACWTDDDAEVSRALVRGLPGADRVQTDSSGRILTTDQKNQGGWEKSVVEVNKYQNGGYWGRPAAGTLGRFQVRRGRSERVGSEYIQLLRSHMREDGTTQGWNGCNVDTATTRTHCMWPRSRCRTSAFGRRGYYLCWIERPQVRPKG